MPHLIILTGILAMAVGIVSLMYVHRLTRRHSFPFLKIFLHYLIVLNVAAMLNLALHYLLTNVLGFLAIRQKLLLVLVVNIIGFFLLVVLTYLYFQLTRSLIGKALGPMVRHATVLFTTAAALAYGFAMAMFAATSRAAVFIVVHAVCVSLPNAACLVASVILFFKAKTLPEKRRIRTLRIFSLVYAGFFGILFLNLLLPVQVWVAVSTFNLLVLNAIPVLFLSRFLRHEDGAQLAKAGTRERIERFYDRHGLSRREREIADLLAAGKSNEEIEQELYISIFTVKKHVSNIFLKLGINSRAQFSHLVMRAALADSPDIGPRKSGGGRD